VRWLSTVPRTLTFAAAKSLRGDIVYIGYCQKSEYKAEWRVGDETQFRLKKDKMYLKRPNGKELRLVFLLQAKVGADAKPITILKVHLRD